LGNDPEKMAHFGIDSTQALGIKSADLKPYARTIGKNQELSEALWNQPIHEAKHLAILLAEPQKLPEEIAEKWIRELYSWDLCDGLGMKVFPKTSFGLKKVSEWAKREREFEKRTSFATMVGIILNSKVADSIIETFFPIIERESCDDRNFVKKGVNWALRQAGKRNLSLNQKAMECAERIKSQGTKTARWIATDAIRELKSDKVKERIKKRADKKSAPFTTNPD